MSRASIPPMTNDTDNPRLHLGMDALLTKLLKLSFLQAPRFQMYLLDFLIHKWFSESPRELFEIMMKAEYKWRLSLHAPYNQENEAMSSSVVGYDEPMCTHNGVEDASDCPHALAGVPLKGEAEPQAATDGYVADGGNVPLGGADDHSEEIADQYYHRGWNEGRSALREEVLGDEAKQAIKSIVSKHIVHGNGSCSCGRGWSPAHVALRVMDYFRNEFTKTNEEPSGPSGRSPEAL